METSPRAYSQAPFVMQAGGVRVRPTGVRKSLVVPAEATKECNEWIPLSNLDRVVTPTFTSVIHFYEGAVTKDRLFSTVLNGLKKSLSEVLVHFFPLAGRLELRADGLIDLHCNDKGAVFVEATMGQTLADLGGPQPMDGLSGLQVAGIGRGALYIPDQLTPIPTLIIQVTQFKCGSIAIATNWHHTVADGSSGCHFVKSWGEVATGKGLSLVPDHNRRLLASRDPPNPTLVNGYSTKTEHDFNQIDTEIVRKCTGATEPPVVKTFHLHKKIVQGLKQRANLELGETAAKSFTSAEGISAHLWQTMTRAREEGQNSETMDPDHQPTTTRFFMFVDGRKKLSMPAGYFGNVVCSACAVATEEEILKKPLAEVAALIRDATAKVTGDYFRSLIDWVEVQGTTPSKSEHVNSAGHDVAATFWVFFPLFEIEFGFGRPTFTARNSPPRPLIDGIAMMPSAVGPGHLVALLNLHGDRMKRLAVDSQFSSVYSTRPSDETSCERREILGN